MTEVDGAGSPFEVDLERAPQYAEALLVTGERAPPPEPTQELAAATVSAIPGAGEDALQSLKAMPGVVGRDDWSGRLYVRGGRPDQNGIYLDGIPIYDPYRLFGVTSVFNPELLESITLYPGGFDARYGDRLSAVIAGENRVGRTDRALAGSANLSLTNANLRAEGRLGFGVPSSFLVSVRRTYFDVVAPGASLPTFTDLQARLLVEPSPRDRITLTLLGAREDTDVTLDERQFDDVPKSHAELGDNQRDLAFGLQGRHLFGEAVRLHYVASWTNDTQASQVYFRDGETGYELRLDQDLDASATTLRTWVEGQLGAHTLEAGCEAARSENRVGFEIATDDPRVVIPDSLKSFGNRQGYWRSGAFVQDTWAVADTVDLKAGVRWDRSGLAGQSAVGPRASLAWRPRRGWELRGAWGRYSQSPSYEALQGDGYFLDLRGIKEAGVRPERAEHLLAGAAYTSPDDWKLAVDAYTKRLTDQLASGEEPHTVLVLGDDGQAREYTRDELTFLPENARRGTASGAQLVLTLLEGRGRPYWGMLAYTYGKVRSRDAERSRWEDYDQRHSALVIGGLKLGRAWEIGWRWHYASGFPYTPLGNVIRVVDDLDGDGIYEPELGETLTYQRDEPDAAINSRRLPPYHRLDLRVDYLLPRDSIDWTFYLDVINAYARTNVEDYTYNADYTRRDAVEGLRILPSVGIRARF
ncbi:MAG: TonB-dependent receptor [Micrococcales bacterium]|nr:TonB-dependent receptor [Micrococcales bacterium]